MYKELSFAERYHQSEDWQKETFNEICDAIEKHPTKKANLEEKDLEHILWLSGFDQEVKNKAINLYTKLLEA